MKTLLLSLISVLALNSYAQLTYVPDDAFEAYIEANIPGASNGAVDDSVNTVALTWGTTFIIQGGTYPILDFTGIEAFTSVDGLFIYGVPATSIDLSALTQFGSSNRALQINDCFALTEVLLPAVPMSAITFTDNPSLTNINFPSGLTMVAGPFELLQFTGLNSIGSIDISNISIQASINITVLENTSLTSLNLANGGCLLYGNVNIQWNPNLYCVQVDDPSYSYIATGWMWTEEYSWPFQNPSNPNNPYQYVTSGNCTVGIEELSNTPKQLLKIVDLMGRETPYKPNTVLIYVYDDGTTEKVFKMEE